ncbi:MAG: choice-of-anchor D domain-containing protein [Myxococcales bacterium]|nr:choice-of-anchor D domain-containing protein [Myxococcales bacterium]
MHVGHRTGIRDHRRLWRRLSPSFARRLLATALLFAASCSERFSVGDDRRLDARPESLVVASRGIGAVTPARIELRNVGTAGPIRIVSVRFEGEAIPELSITSYPESLGAGDAGGIELAYTATDALPDVASLLIEHDGPAPTTVRVDVTTLPPAPVLVAKPTQVAFGDVGVGTSDQTSLTFVNEGSSAVTVTGLGLELDAGAPFALSAFPALPLVVEPGDSFDCTLTYAPQPGLADRVHLARLVVRADHPVVDGLAVPVSGYARHPGLKLDPARLDFGWLTVGKSDFLSVTLSNTGARPIAVSRLAGITSAEVSLIGAPAAPFTLAAGEGVGFVLRFAPFAPIGPALGVLEVESDDVRNVPMRSIPITGRAAFPSLALYPPDVIDFGVVAALHRVERRLRIVNEGEVPVRVDAVTATVKSEPGFRVVSAPALPFTLARGGTAEVVLSYENPGEAEGVVWGAIEVASDDPAAASALVALRARHGAFPECLPIIAPGSVDFGAVGPGAVVERELTLLNEGSLPCVFRSAAFVDCEDIVGPCVPRFGPSASFGLGNDAPGAGIVLLSGEFMTLPIRFTATYDPDGGALLGTGPRGALPVVTFARGLAPDAPLLQRLSPYGGIPATLRGTVGDSGIRATPPLRVFPLTSPGCASAAATVELTRLGEAPLEFTGFTFGPECAGTFTANVPSLPLPLPAPTSAAGPLTIPVRFTPTQPGAATCELRFHGSGVGSPNGSTATVVLTGVGALGEARQDTFKQVDELAVDLLFVVDSSGSMGDEQDALIQGFESLLAAASSWQVDFQIGVITTDVSENGRIRRPFANNAWPWSFASSAAVGTGGSGDERGLQTAWTALQPNLLYDPGVPCSAGCPSGTSCVEGQCGAANRGFIREGALLALVWVSDEDEHACETPVADFVDFFSSLKPPGLLKAYGIIGDAPTPELPYGGCGGGATPCPACDTECYQSGGGPKSGAEAGVRYHDAIAALGGTTFSICAFGDESGPSILEQLGNDAFKPNQRFRLSEAPSLGTIEVLVNGFPCQSGWSYDEPTRDLVFALESVCFPGPGASVVVRYDAVCIAP